MRYTGFENTVRLDPQYTVSEMRSALLVLSFTKAAIEEAKKKLGG